MQRLLIDRSDITRIRRDERASSPLEQGQARLRVRRVALTANNITYAAVGEVIGYWKFFPSSIEGHGLLPVWGFADVVETSGDVLAVGERYYGFFPLADEVVMTPEAKGDGFRDVAAHRQDLPPLYNRYARAPAQSDTAESLQALLQPLLATSYLLADWLADNDYFGASQVIVGSASSKTGLGLTRFLAEAADHPVDIVGLTSAGNAEFVKNLGTCDTVVTYEAIDEIALSPSVYVDMSGNAEVKTAVHARLNDLLRHSSAVGTSHWDKFRPGLKLAGPKPEFFFAPAQMEKRRADWGPGEVQQRIGAAIARVAQDADAWLTVAGHSGWDDVEAVYGALADGSIDPREGHVFHFD